MIPGDAITSVALTNTFRAPNDLPYQPLTQTVWGGKLIGDASQGRLFKYWIISYDVDTIKVNPIDGPVVFTLLAPDIKTVSLAFDNNMGLTITYTKSDGAYLYYFNAVTSQYITRFFAGVTSSRVCVDDAREFYLSQSDVLFVYTLNGKLNYRRQRDRYDIEKLIGNASGGLLRVGQNVVNRLQFELGINLVTAPPTPIPQPYIVNLEGTLFPLNPPLLVSFTGTDQIIGTPIVVDISGNIYALNTPVLVDITGSDVSLRAPRLTSFEGQIYSLDRPVMIEFEGVLPLTRPTIVSLEGTLAVSNTGSHRYWRVYITDNNGDTYTSMQQVELRASIGGSSECPVYPPIYQSDFYNNSIGTINTAANLCNRNYTDFSATPWVSAANVPLPHWIYIDLGSSIKIVEAAIFCQSYVGGPARAPRNFLIQSSDDTLTWTTFTTVIGAEDWLNSVGKVFNVQPNLVINQTPTKHTNYYDSVRSKSPYLYYRFNELAGTIANDSSDNKRNGTYTQDVAGLTTTGLLFNDTDRAVTFSAPNGKKGISVAGDLSLFSSQSWSVELVFRNDAPAPRTAVTIFQAGIPTSPSARYPELIALNYDATSYNLSLNYTGIAEIFKTTDTFNYGQKYHIVLRYNFNTQIVELLVNTIVKATTSVQFNNSSGPLNIAYAEFEALNYYSGNVTVDDFALYAAILSDQQVMSDYTLAFFNSVPADYNKVVLGDIPYAFWKLDELSGIVMTDSTKNAINGVYGGLAILNQEPILSAGRSVAVNNVSSDFVILVDDRPQLRLLGDFAIEFNFKTSATTGKLFTKEQGGLNYPSYEMVLIDGKIRFNFRSANGPSVDVYIESPVINDGIKKNFIIERQGSRVTMYVNGSPVSTITTLVMLWASTDKVGIGCAYVPSLDSYATIGTFDDIAVYLHSLGPANVIRHYNAAIGAYDNTVPKNAPAGAYRYFRLSITRYKYNGVDGTASGTDVRVAEFKINSITASDPVIPSLTSNIAPLPYVARSSSTASAAFDSYKAFDGDLTDTGRWISSTSGGVQWIEIDLGYGNFLTPSSFSVTPDGAVTIGNGYFPVDFRVDGSMTGQFVGEETTILAANNLQTGWFNNQSRSFLVGSIPSLTSAEGTPVPLSAPRLNSLEGVIVAVSRPNLVSIEGTTAQKTNQSSTNDLVFMEPVSDSTDLILFDQSN